MSFEQFITANVTEREGKKGQNVFHPHIYIYIPNNIESTTKLVLHGLKLVPENTTIQKNSTSL